MHCLNVSGIHASTECMLMGLTLNGSSVLQCCKCTTVIRGATPGPLFQLENGVPLMKTRFIVKFREALTQIGIDASKYASHSFRIGAATIAAQHGIEDSVIQKWEDEEEHSIPLIYPTNHQRNSLQRYISGILSSTKPTQ